MVKRWVGVNLLKILPYTLTINEKALKSWPRVMYTIPLTQL